MPFTYFVGATPDNNYTPPEPYTLVVESNHVSEEEAGYMKLFIPCGGADARVPLNSDSAEVTASGFYGSNIC